MQPAGGPTLRAPRILPPPTGGAPGCPTSRGFRDVGFSAGTRERMSSSITSELCTGHSGVDSSSLTLVFMPRALKRYYGGGDLHFITCSCYQRRPMLGTARR